MTTRRRSQWFIAAAVFGGACAQGQPTKPKTISRSPQVQPVSIASKPPALRNETTLGVRIAIPDGWHRSDMSEAGVHVLVFSPTKEDLSTRISLLNFPGMFLPDGIATRETQLKLTLGDEYKRVRLEPFAEGKLRGEVLEYEAAGDAAHRTVEYSARRDDEILIIQFASPATEWTRTATLAKKTLATLEVDVAKKADLSFVGPAESEKEAQQEQFKTDVRIDAHSLDVRINPETGAFESVDKLTLTAREKDVFEAQLLMSKFDSIAAIDDRGKLDCKLSPFGGDGEVQKLTIKLRQKLRKGRSAEVTVGVTANKYDFRTKDSPVSGYHILGQVAKDSSYSSHVLYYPTDDENRAKAALRFHVPEGYVAVGPGKLVSQKRTDATLVYEWAAVDGLVKQLPYGWAIAKYTLVEGKSRSQVPIRVYALAKHAARAQNVLRVAVDVIDFYEQRFGPFPFGAVSIADVQPVKGIAGVSLPSMVLLSAEFFNGAESYDVIKDVEASSQGPLVIADELSHQYNFYSVALPNQLAEGLAQYSDSLFAEHIVKADLHQHFDYYSRMYRGAVATSPDRPIISDSVYNTPAYMGIVFSKGACVLHMLRAIVGDEVFFASLRRFFQEFKGKEAGLDDLQRVFETEAGNKLGWFFDQWYRQSGYPKLKITWQQNGDSLALTIKQTQGGEPFRIPLRLSVTAGGNASVVEIELANETHDVSVPVTGKVQKIELSKSPPILAEVSM